MGCLFAPCPLMAALYYAISVLTLYGTLVGVCAIAEVDATTPHSVPAVSVAIMSVDIWVFLL